MTELRKRMIECLQLRGLSERTQEMYVRAVRQLAEHYRKSPDVITEEELRQYFLYLKNVKQYSRSASTIALCGIKFFFQHTLNRDWTTLSFVRAPREQEAAGDPQPRRGPQAARLRATAPLPRVPLPRSTPVVYACRRAPISTCPISIALAC